MSATIYEIKRGNQHSNIPNLKRSIHNKPPRDYRFIDDIVGSAKT